MTSLASIAALPSAEIAPPSPLAALRALAALPYPFLLHSAGGAAQDGWSFFGADPFAVLRGGDPREAAALWRACARVARGASPPEIDAPFTGGAVGYWSYDLGRRFERLPALARDDLGLPDHAIALYDVVGAWHHGSDRAWVFSTGLPLEGGLGLERARRRLDEFRRRLDRGARAHAPPEPAAGAAPRAARSTFTREGYLRAVERVRAHIAAGDIFQANLSQRWTLAHDAASPLGLALPLFAALAERSPAPYAAFLGAGDHAVVSSSPERFLALRGGEVETRPIKGTRPRGADAAEDARLARELLGSEKDRAENVMIVDVLRNDLGRVCETGTVRVERLCELEAFPQVFHLVSTVTGRLRPGADFFDLLAASFPGGSITGAPKIRAMEVIESLEPVRRHVYTGAIGYLDWSGDADWNVAIRTALVTPGQAHVAAGGGIVSDSDAEREYQETLDKAEGLRLGLERVLGRVRLEPTEGPEP